MYETEQDRDRERAAADICAAAWDLKWRQMEPAHPYDLLFYEDGTKHIRHYAEYKYRNCNFDSFSTLIIDLAKIARGRYFANLTAGATYRIIIEWQDHMAYIDITDDLLPLDVRLGGRTRQERDEHDTDVVAHLPVRKFVTITKEKQNALNI